MLRLTLKSILLAPQYHARRFFIYGRIVLAYYDSQYVHKPPINCREMTAWGSADIDLISVNPDVGTYSIGGGSFIDTDTDTDTEKLKMKKVSIT